jgi:putative methyltransferase (TIGR04325 family)
VIKRFINKVNVLINPKPIYGWSGYFSTWDEASALCSGYNQDTIFQKVKEATLKVKNNEAVYERDSVIFEKVEYSYPLAAFLMWSFFDNKNLDIIDFGGSLGSTYYQNRLFLQKIENLNWNIVEQEKFVEIGKTYFEDENLHFYYSVEECLNKSSNKINTIIFSSVLQYLSSPYELLNQILSNDFKNIIIDITTIHDEDFDRITIQQVPPSIYEASYPTWFFSEKKFINFFESKGYRLVNDWNLNYNINIGKHKGYFFIK